MFAANLIFLIAGVLILTNLTHTKQESRPSDLESQLATSASEAEQILQLKRLLVTLKQHYEKIIQNSTIQLQAEQSQCLVLQKELETAKNLLALNQKLHDEELQALRDQQVALKNLLKKAQEERSSDASYCEQSELVATRQRLENLEQTISYLRSRNEEANIETEQMRAELDETKKKYKILEQESNDYRQQSQKEIEHYQQLISSRSIQENQLETVFSQNSSHHLRQELETIKRNLVTGNQETKALEARYIEVLNEKIGLEHQFKQLQMQLEHQSSNLTAFQAQLHLTEDHKKALELALQSKENEYKELLQHHQALQSRSDELEKKIEEKEYIQDQYEQLKEEWKQSNDRLDEALEMRIRTEEHLNQMESISKHQLIQIQEFENQMHVLIEEKQLLENELGQLRILLEESETRLKVAQQHLAKKVKESALLGEKVEEQQMNLTDFLQTIEHQKMQLAQLQASVDIYQKQEKRLQEQLHDALKGSESQASKWEEKYFRMYDKWQESENKIRELKKFEEKHLQMQNLLANLGNFMGGSFNHSSPSSFPPNPELLERSTRSFSFDNSHDIHTHTNYKADPQEEKYDLFGMRHPHDPHQPNLFS